MCEVCRSDVMDEIRNLVPDPADPGLSLIKRSSQAKEKGESKDIKKRSLYKKKKDEQGGKKGERMPP